MRFYFYPARFLSLVLLAVFCASANSAHAISSAVNISTRLNVESGDNVLIGGFIVEGTGQKKLLLRALGPSLPVSGALSDPILELHDSTGAIIMSNDNWRTSQQDQIIATGAAPTNDKESALIATVAAGSYTAIVRGVNNGTGVGLVEVYDLDGANPPARLGNISTRGDVGTGDGVMIGGFIVSGDLPKRVLIRADGPSLNVSGVPLSGRLMDPMLELHDANGALISQNDNWRTNQQAEIQASSIPPSNDYEPALISTLTPGNYTAIVSGNNSTTGIALVEVYDLDQPPQTDGSTIFVTQLRASGASTSPGSGIASLRLSADGSSAVVSFDYSSLSGPITDLQIQQNGGTLFDLSSATPQADGTYLWTIAPVGNESVAQIDNAIETGLVNFTIDTAQNPSGEISGSFNLSTGGQTAPTPTPPPALASGTPTPTDAGRFLSQSTFGATDALLTKVQSEGFQAFLNEQFAIPNSSHTAYVDAEAAAFPTPSPGATPIPLTIQQTNDAWWTYAVNGPDQLRQRVAFALSEFFVISNSQANLGNQPAALPVFCDVLANDAFTNFRTLLEDVTLNPAMGAYLNMLKNDKGNPSKGTHPNENYAREIMQLFSIGLYDLSLDGSQTLDSSGQPIATYDQNAILGTAAAFTGWTYGGQTGTPVFNAVADWRDPMINIAAHHDTNPKSILNGVLVPGGQTADQDLAATLDTIFNHQNVGPFFCKQLIQRLVTSNPSPGYVYRVASVFNNNGQGVRGDMKAVLSAIFLDYEARGNPKPGQGIGKQREPVVRVTNLLRAFAATSPSDNLSVRNAYASLGEESMHSPTVFNFFTPDYAAPGTIADAGLTSPEFELTTESTSITTANFLRNAIYTYLGPSTDKITLSLTNEQTLAANPAQLVAHLNSLFMASTMSSDMQNIVTNAVTQIPANNPLERVRTALYLVINSPEYTIEK